MSRTGKVLLCNDSMRMRGVGARDGNLRWHAEMKVGLEMSFKFIEKQDRKRVHTHSKRDRFRRRKSRWVPPAPSPSK